MAKINNMVRALEDRNIAQLVGIPHDTARMKFQTRSNTVKNMGEYRQIVRSYVKHHHSECISSGGSMSNSEAEGIAREILEQEFRRRGGDYITGYNMAQEGVDGGLKAVLDIIAEGLKAMSVERFIRHTFDNYVAPNAWDQKVEIIREFIAHYGAHLSSSIDVNNPERYASDYYELIRNYTEAMRRTSSVFRRL